MDSIIEFIEGLEASIVSFMEQYMETIQTIIDNLMIILNGDDTSGDA